MQPSSAIAAKTAYKKDLSQISKEAVGLVSRYLNSEMAVLCLSEKLQDQEEGRICATGVDTESIQTLTDAITKAITARSVPLSQPRVLVDSAELRFLPPESGVRTLLVIPLIDQGVYHGFLLLGSSKPNYGQNITHDFLVSLGRTIGTTRPDWNGA